MNRSVFTRASLMACCFLCLGPVAAADYEAAVLALNPTHYWRLNETTVDTSTATVVDSVGGLNGLHAGGFDPGEGEVGVDGPPVPGLSDDNVAFGANNWASVDLGPGADLAASTMTFAGWFTENGSEGGDRLWTNNQSDGNVSFQIFFGGGFGETAASLGIGLNPAVNGFPESGLPSGSGVGNFHISDATVPTKDGEWHHIVASRNGNNIEDVIVVIDGVNYGPETWADSTDTWGTTGTNAQIATRTPGDGGGAQQALNGSVDEVAIWLDRQLTVEESIALYNAALQVGIPGDYDADSDVDGNDFIVWQKGDSPNGATSGDLDIWEANFPTPPAVVATASVPEPATLAQLVILAAGLVTMRRRRS